MARFYEAPDTNFVEDFMYQPPWEMMQQALLVNEQGTQNALAQAELFKNLDIKYIDDPVERENVQKVKDYYTSKADEISNAIVQDPTKWRSYLPEISKFSRELQEDMTSGNIAKFQGSYTNLQQWMKDNEKIKTSDPDLYNRLYNKWYNDWAQGNRSLDRTFQGKQIIGSEVVNMMNKEFRDFMSDFKADKIDKQNGMYLVGDKWVAKEDVERAAYDLISSKPQFSGWIQQMGYDLQDPGYYDAETQKLREVYQFTDSSGNPITADQAEQLRQEYLALTPEEQQAQGIPYNYGLNPNHALTSGFRAMGNIYGFRETSVSADPVQMEIYKQREQTQRNRETIQAANWRTIYTQQQINDRDANRLAFDYYKLELEDQRALEKEAASGNKNAQKVLHFRDLNVLEGTSVRPDRNSQDDLQAIRNGDSSAIGRNTEAFKYALNRIDGKPYLGSNLTKEQRQDFLIFAQKGLHKGWNNDKIIEEYAKQKNIDISGKAPTNTNYILMQSKYNGIAENFNKQEALKQREQQLRNSRNFEEAEKVKAQRIELNQELLNGKYKDRFQEYRSELDKTKNINYTNTQIKNTWASDLENFHKTRQEWYEKVYNPSVIGGVNYHPMNKQSTDLFLHDYKINPAHFNTVKQDKDFGKVQYVQASDYSYGGQPTLRLVDEKGKTKIVVPEKNMKNMDTWTRNLIIQGVDPAKSGDLIAYMTNPQASSYITELQNSSDKPKPIQVTNRDGKKETKNGYQGFVKIGNIPIPMILTEDNAVYVKQDDGSLLHFDNMNIFTQEINKTLN